VVRQWRRGAAAVLSKELGLSQQEQEAIQEELMTASKNISKKFSENPLDLGKRGIT
jgi:hypothetical protein